VNSGASWSWLAQVSVRCGCDASEPDKDPPGRLDEALAVDASTSLDPPDTLAVDGPTILDPPDALAVDGPTILDPPEALAVDGPTILDPPDALAVDGATILDPPDALAVDGPTTLEDSSHTSINLEGPAEGTTDEQGSSPLLVTTISLWPLLLSLVVSLPTSRHTQAP